MDLFFTIKKDKNQLNDSYPNLKLTVLCRNTNVCIIYDTINASTQKWTRRDSNPRPSGYEPDALTN